MTASDKKKQNERPSAAEVESRRRGVVPGGWPSTWNWGGGAPRKSERRPDLRDLHGDYSEQVGAFFG